MAKPVTITFYPTGVKTAAMRGTTILDAAVEAKVSVVSACGGYAKSCGKCRVRLLTQKRGALSRLSGEEKRLLSKTEQRSGVRLACCAKVYADIDLFVPPESRGDIPRILTGGRGRPAVVKPAVAAYHLRLSPPTLADNRDDFTRLKEALHLAAPYLAELRLDYQAARRISAVLRAAKWDVTALVLYDSEIIAVRPGDAPGVYGVAADIGTTTVAAYLCDLRSGKLLRTAAAVNGQAAYGADVVTRAAYCMRQADGLETLNRALKNTLNALIAEMTAAEGLSPEDICELTLVGNTVMSHIALNIPPDFISVSPFISTFWEKADIKARDLGFAMLSGGNVHCLPSVAGFTGADCVGALIAEEPYNQPKTRLLIDIGTNGEIALAAHGKLYATSCATGPALEGAEISCGMRAEAGAIQYAAIDPVTLEPTLSVIGDTAPRGLCGSAALDVCAQLAQTGVIDSEGKFAAGLNLRRVRARADGKRPEYVLHFAENPDERDIVFTQKDVRAVQLAKAALYSGARALLAAAGAAKVDEVVLAGAFGNYINRENALKLGLFPDCPLAAVSAAGNAAGEGARLALLNVDKRAEAGRIAREIIFVENAAQADFSQTFAAAIAIPHARDLFTANLPGAFPCGGLDTRLIPEELQSRADCAGATPAEIFAAAKAMAEAEGASYLRLPVTQAAEAQALGVVFQWKSGALAAARYPCARIGELKKIPAAEELMRSRPVQTALAALRLAGGERVIFDVTGPFSLLAAMLEPTRLIRGMTADPEEVRAALQKAAAFLTRYIQSALDGGAAVISLADPVGTVDFLGENLYRAFAAPAVRQILAETEPYLGRSLVHLCGKTSASLQKCGVLRLLPRRVPPGEDYRDLLFAVAAEPKTRFVGAGCVNRGEMPAPIIWTGTLVKEDASKHSEPFRGVRKE
ncbi:MAG: ASKHA domain-containing protein [Gracilibacteraceae bacterium]|nr:ASKHA domain-containing protein [Gracilibacteraceae bacterium]